MSSTPAAVIVDVAVVLWGQCYKTFYGHNCKISQSVFWQAFLQPNLLFASKARSLQAPLLVWSLALTANIRLQWKGLPGTNSQAYSAITAVKSFIASAPGETGDDKGEDIDEEEA
jgi:hypothetical protein